MAWRFRKRLLGSDSAVPVVSVALKMLCAASSLLATQAAPAVSTYQKIGTDFGYVIVDPRDVEAAIQEGEATMLAARRVFLLEGVTFAIIEEGSNGRRWGESEGGVVTYTWTFPHGSRRFKPRAAINALRHEIAHDLFARHLVPITSTDQYGTDAPDWLDEMAALAFESTEQRTANMRSGEKFGLIELQNLFRMRHPELGATVVLDEGSDFADRPPSSDLTIPFYATAGSFYEFLLDRTGEESIIVELAEAFRKGEDLELWLLARLGYGTQRELLSQMNQDFLVWFAEQKLQAVVSRE